MERRLRGGPSGGGIEPQLSSAILGEPPSTCTRGPRRRAVRGVQVRDQKQAGARRRRAAVRRAAWRAHGGWRAAGRYRSGHDGVHGAGAVGARAQAGPVRRGPAHARRRLARRAAVHVRVARLAQAVCRRGPGRRGRQSRRSSAGKMVRAALRRFTGSTARGRPRRAGCRRPAGWRATPTRRPATWWPSRRAGGAAARGRRAHLRTKPTEETEGRVPGGDEGRSRLR